MTISMRLGSTPIALQPRADFLAGMECERVILSEECADIRLGIRQRGRVKATVEQHTALAVNDQV